MSQTDCDGAIRNIEKEILRECNIHSIQVYPNFLNYFIKLLTLDPSWGIFSNFMTNRADVQHFIRHVVENLKNQGTTRMVLLKIQFYFKCNFDQRYRTLKTNKDELYLRLKPLEDEIFEAKLDAHVDVEMINRRIVFYICMASGLGNPNLDPVYKEVRTAYGSIVTNEAELKEFLQSPKYLKEEMLQEYVQLVTGVRIFNKDCGKGGEGMEDLPWLITEALKVLRGKIDNNLLEIMNMVNLLTTALDYIICVVPDEREDYRVEYEIPLEYDPEDLEVLKDFLIIYRQLEVLLRVLAEEVDREVGRSRMIFDKLRSVLIILHKVVKHRIAIPVEEVFPHFTKLADIYSLMQDETILMAKLTQIMNKVLEYPKILSFRTSLATMLIPSSGPSMTDAERLSRISDGEIIPQLNDNYDVNVYESDLEISYLKIEILGFCPWILTKTDGALIPGNPKIGVVSVLNMNFVFSSVQAGIAFVKNPQKSVMNFINFIRKRPELITLLNFKRQVSAVQEIVELVRDPPLKPLTAEINTQTDTHFVESNIDKNYKWNVWDLKRQAIHYANLTHCKTVSSQTMKSFHRLATQTQTYGHKDQGHQTKKDNYTNVPTPSNFIYGLRGRKDDKQFIIDLTRPVEE